VPELLCKGKCWGAKAWKKKLLKKAKKGVDKGGAGW